MPTPRIKAFWGGGKGIECRHPLKNLKGLSSPKYFATNLSTQLYWWLSPTLCSVRFLCLFSLSIFYRVSIKVNKANEIENLNKVIKGMRSNFIKMNLRLIISSLRLTFFIWIASLFHDFEHQIKVQIQDIIIRSFYHQRWKNPRCVEASQYNKALFLTMTN